MNALPPVRTLCQYLADPPLPPRHSMDQIYIFPEYIWNTLQKTCNVNCTILKSLDGHLFYIQILLFPPCVLSVSMTNLQSLHSHIEVILAPVVRQLRAM